MSDDPQDAALSARFKLAELGAMSVAEEAMKLVFDAIDFDREGRMRDGRTAKITEFYAPKIDSETGDLSGGIDVHLYRDGEKVSSSHIEFCLRVSGWGHVPMSLLGRLRAFARWPAGVAPWIRERRKREAERMRVINMVPAFPRANYGSRNALPRGIVFHQTDNYSAAQTRRTLTDKGYSTTFEIERDGTILGYLNPENDIPYASGRGNNSMTIAIDLTHKHGQDWPAAQLASARWLTEQLLSRFPIPRAVAPARCANPLTTGPYVGCGPTVSAQTLIGQGYGLMRHRNLKQTACPGNFPIDTMIARGAGPAIADAGSSSPPASGGGGSGAVIAGLIAILAALS